VDITVLIPAYKKLDRIPKALDKLRFRGDFEVIVAGDCLSPRDRKFLKERGVVLDHSEKRRGKANALNQASEKAKGELLVFIDSDTCPEDSEFLEKIWRNYKERNFEIGTGKVMVNGDSLLERSINVEYMFINSAVFLGNLFRKAMPLIGAFIVVTKDAFNRIGKFAKVILEDIDLGCRANTSGLRFFYMKDVTVYTSSPKRFRDWMVQRKRWVIGGSQSIWAAKKEAIKNFPLSLAAITSCYPLLSISLMLLVAATFAMSQVSIVYILSVTALLTTSLMLVMNRVLNWGISLSSGIHYLLWYGPIWSTLLVIELLYFSFKKDKPADWVV